MFEHFICSLQKAFYCGFMNFIVSTFAMFRNGLEALSIHLVEVPGAHIFDDTSKFCHLFLNFMKFTVRYKLIWIYDRRQRFRGNREHLLFLHRLQSTFQLSLFVFFITFKHFSDLIIYVGFIWACGALCIATFLKLQSSLDLETEVFDLVLQLIHLHLKFLSCRGSIRSW